MSREAGQGGRDEMKMKRNRIDAAAHGDANKMAKPRWHGDRLPGCREAAIVCKEAKNKRTDKDIPAARVQIGAVAGSKGRDERRRKTHE